eukprot:958202-Prorocentrum_minimum.AAC.2
MVDLKGYTADSERLYGGERTATGSGFTNPRSAAGWSMVPSHVDCKGYRVDIKGYIMALKGYRVDRKGYKVDRKGYMVDLKGYMVDLKGYNRRTCNWTSERSSGQAPHSVAGVVMVRERV